MSVIPAEPRPGESSNETSGISYLRYFRILLHHIRRHYGLLIILTFAYACAGIVLTAVLKPEYTAVAILGQAPSPLGDLTGLTGKLGGALGSGITKKLGLSGGGGNGDIFDQYTELLSSNRLAEKLTQNQNILPALFPRRYNWLSHDWLKQDDIFSSIKNVFKGALHYPIKERPDSDDVAKYLKRNITVDAPLTSSFVTVSLRSETPEKAAWILNTLLLDADTIIRNDRRRDVGARIEYLSQILPSVTQADQKQSLSEILSDQQQSMMMIRADQRYASALVDPPHASLIPTSPNLVTVFGSMVLLAMLSWFLLIHLLPDGYWLLSIATFSYGRRKGSRPDADRQEATDAVGRRNLVTETK